MCQVITEICVTPEIDGWLRVLKKNQLFDWCWLVMSMTSWWSIDGFRNRNKIGYMWVVKELNFWEGINKKKLSKTCRGFATNPFPSEKMLHLSCHVLISYFGHHFLWRKTDSKNQKNTQRVIGSCNIKKICCYFCACLGRV